MKKYVLVFAFDDAKEKVALIRKIKPEWQAGKLNGIGGKIEKGEFPINAAMREFKEEAGVDLLNITEIGIIKGDGWEVWLYRGLTNMDHVKTMEEEEVCVFKIDEIPYDQCIGNLKYLIPISMDSNLYKIEIME